MNRRQFFVGWIFQERRATLQVEVMEIFSSSAGPSAFLVHHASEASRNAFAEWLRANDGAPIAFRVGNGARADGWIFRMKMCFGRGLILTRERVSIRAKQVLSIG